jgi:CCDC81 eukaryotic HU domain 1
LIKFQSTCFSSLPPLTPLHPKAVTFPGLGTFSYIHKKQDIGNKGVKTTRTPVFVVAEAFCQTNAVNKDSFSNLTSKHSRRGVA